MGRKGRTTHKWTEVEHQKLLEVVQDATSLLDHYKRQGYTQTDWWSCVAGMLYQKAGPAVTGKACARQFDLLMSRMADEGCHEDDWGLVSKMVDEYEVGLLEAVDERLEHVERGLKTLARMMDCMARELGVQESWE